MDLLAHFLDVVEPITQRLQETPVVVGVSGGPDSLALLHLFVRAQPQINTRPIAVHVNHGIRDEQAQADAVFVAEMAARWGVEQHTIGVDVPVLVDERELTVEEAARLARYSALAKVAQQQDARLIAVGHSANDQTETILLNLLRGSGLAGLRGMSVVSPLSEAHLLAEDARLAERLQILRPLLDVARSQINAYCRTQNLEPRTDATNLDEAYRRNRLRQSVVPLLEEINPNLHATLGRTSQVLAADYDYLQQRIDTAWQEIQCPADGDDIVCMDLDGWRELHLSLQRGILRRALAHIDRNAEVGFQHIEDALHIGQSGGTGAEAPLPGGLGLRVGYEHLIIGRLEMEAPPEWPLLAVDAELPVSLSEQIALPGGWRFVLKPYNEMRSGLVGQSLFADRWQTPLCADAVMGSLRLRTRQPGDTFQPMGVGGTQSVSDFMINEKIPAAWRERIPLLVDEKAIIWVCGWRVDERFKVTGNCQEVWLAQYIPPA